MSSNASRSLNSGGKSKRGRDSNSDRSNNNNNNNNKKKIDTNQKTLGMAWGSNSLSSSKSSSFRKSPFTDFGSYMVEKNRKLRDQFDADASSSSLVDLSYSKPIFHGVSIFVDGFTVPSSQELRSYMLKYGGRLENYFSRHRVTHIICSNLPDSKIKNIRSFSGGLPVVKPTWVLDSIAANRLLNWVPYQLEQLNEVRGQSKLSAFFALKRSSSSEGAEAPLNSHMELDTDGCLPKGGTFKDSPSPELGESLKYITDTEGTVPQGGTFKDSPSPEVGESVNYTNECSGETFVSGHENPTDAIKDEADSVDVGENFFEGRTEEPSSTDVKSASNVKEALQSSPHKSSTSVSSHCFDKQKAKGSSEPSITGDFNHRHSTLGDPNFVKNYFKYSRLHFIGTWRNRYRKRFPTSPGNPNVNAHNISQKAAIIHIDMDCFFVSVVIRNHPELQDKPVAVCHSDNPRGTAEISSANYPARDYGIRAGIFVRDAKALCPHLVIVPYNFEAYEEVADQFYDILHKHCNKVQAVSCDEAFLDVTDRVDEDPEFLASIIRKEIVETTGCTASAGIAGNVLMARLATRTAKPDGQCFIPSEKVESYLSELPIKALPGIGHVLEEKLKKQQIQTCGQLRMISKESLQKDFGLKTGNMLWNYCRGVDNRTVGVFQETKSIGAEVNWGVRFNDLKDSQHFLVNLCNEVSLRLQGCGVQGRTITLKVKKRRKGAGEPTKYMGCGDCENLSHSMTVPSATDDVNVLQRISKQLFGSFHIDVKEIRGIGLQVSKLEDTDMARQGHGKNALRSWLASTSTNMERLNCPAKDRVDGDSRTTDPSYQIHNNQSRNEARSGGVSVLPPICDLDIEVIESLPPELFSEVNAMYSGKLSEFMDKSKSARRKNKEPLFSNSVSLDDTIPKDKSSNLEADILDRDNRNQFPFQISDLEKLNEEKLYKEIQSLSCSREGPSNLHNETAREDRIDVMPASLSQIDISVLQQLPEDLKVGILESLPAHRTPGCSNDNTRDSLRECPPYTISRENINNHASRLDSASENRLWFGIPPVWVYKFESSSHLKLKVLAEMYYKSGSTALLSSILQSTISMHSLSLDTINDEEDEAISSLCELVKQYIEVKIEFDIEEIYICFRLLRRFTMKSTFFLQVYEMVVPYLQASVCEHYGGNLNIALANE